RDEEQKQAGRREREEEAGEPKGTQAGDGQRPEGPQARGRREPEGSTQGPRERDEGPLPGSTGPKTEDTNCYVRYPITPLLHPGTLDTLAHDFPTAPVNERHSQLMAAVPKAFVTQQPRKC
uniref:Uncharacterized protein n=1 Tax=Paramormyrops kingsleyae TaxID=1676925 RepID=A0A3B3R8T7_9TELE